MWASCASKSCLLWDKTLEKPASGILTNHPDQLTSLYWTSEEENKENIVLGDESGNVLTIDPRIPNKILNTTCVSNRSISQIKFNGSNLFGVVSSNTVKIIKANAGSEELKMVHQYVSPQVQYAMCWDKKEKKTFFAVGENKSAVEVKML